MRPANRYERCGVALAMAMPDWWVILTIMLATAIFEPLADIGTIFTVGARLLTGAGKRKLKAGKRRISDGANTSCCCCPDCSLCSDSTPAAYIVTFTGVTACNTVCGHCAFPLDELAFRNTSGTTINGTYTLPCKNTACAWYVNVPGIGTFDHWEDHSACVGTPFATRSDVDINLFKTVDGAGTHFFLTATTDFGGNGSHFSDDIIDDTCNNGGGYSFTNNFTSVSCTLFSYQGSATATPA